MSCKAIPELGDISRDGPSGNERRAPYTTVVAYAISMVDTKPKSRQTSTAPHGDNTTVSYTTVVAGTWHTNRIGNIYPFRPRPQKSEEELFCIYTDGS